MHEPNGHAAFLQQIADHLTDGRPNHNVDALLDGLGTGGNADFLISLGGNISPTVGLLAQATNSEPLQFIKR